MSFHALQKGNGPEEVKREFLIHDVPQEDLLMVAGNMDCHVRSTRGGFEDVMGCFSFGVRSQERENMLRLCQEHNLRVMNSYYRKRQEHLITYKSGGNGMIKIA